MKEHRVANRQRSVTLYRVVTYAAALLLAATIAAQTTGHYGHIFPCANEPDAAYIETMQELGHSLLTAGESQPQGCASDHADAGYTYFGQLIDHDLTFDRTPLEDAHNWAAEDVPNARTPWLDLDQIYCGGPARSKELFVGPDGAEQFRIDDFDLPSNGFYKLIGDQSLGVKDRDFRDLENAILLQLHVLFMRLHNLAVENKMSCGIPECDAIDKTAFNKAARLVRWQYQQLVRRDFLPKVVDPTILVGVQTNGPKYKWEDGKFFIPVEFSTAAFRFGHSAVREKYQLSEHTSKNIGELVDSKFAKDPLPKDLLIDWRYFFKFDQSVQTMTMNAIDTRIAPDLGRIAQYTAGIFTNDPLVGAPSLQRHALADPAELPVRTLQRSAWMRVATAPTIIRALALEDQKLSAKDLIGSTGGNNQSDKPGQKLFDLGLASEPPLFFYILREAEVLECGNRLGPVGSQIVADVIEGSFRSDPDSKWQVRDAWESPEWPLRSGGSKKIESMADLVQVVGK